MNKLPDVKIKNGYNYRLIKRNNKIAIYELTNIKYPEDKSVSYEVFVILISQAYQLIQKCGINIGKVYDYPISEKFPGNEDFGRTAWAYNNENLALEKFDNLTLEPMNYEEIN